MMTMTQKEFEMAIAERFRERDRLYSLNDKIWQLEMHEIRDLEDDISRLDGLSSTSKNYDIDHILNEMEHDLKLKKEELVKTKEDYEKLKKKLDGDDDDIEK